MKPILAERDTTAAIEEGSGPVVLFGLQEGELIRFRDTVIGTLVNRGSTHADAEDAWQEANCRLLDRYPSEIVRHPKQLIFTIAKNLTIDVHRNAKQLPCVEYEMAIPEPASGDGV